jgi:hypothetical protein
MELSRYQTSLDLRASAARGSARHFGARESATGSELALSLCSVLGSRLTLAADCGAPTVKSLLRDHRMLKSCAWPSGHPRSGTKIPSLKWLGLSVCRKARRGVPMVVYLSVTVPALLHVHRRRAGLWAAPRPAS